MLHRLHEMLYCWQLFYLHDKDQYLNSIKRTWLGGGKSEILLWSTVMWVDGKLKGVPQYFIETIYTWIEENFYVVAQLSHVWKLTKKTWHHKRWWRPYTQEMCTVILRFCQGFSIVKNLLNWNHTCCKVTSHLRL